MDNLELLQRIGVALAIGLLFGIERGWVMRKEPEGGRTAGLRTLTLTGLLGGVMGACAVILPEGPLILGLSFLAYAGLIAWFRAREMAEEGTFGVTTILAALLAFALGALAVVGEPAVASAAAVAAAGLLSLKPALHSWLKKLTWEELRAGLVLLAMTLILLPVLPNQGLGPFGALNPYELWLMTILIAALSFAGYIAMKWIGGTHGVALSGLAGGLVSSTAVTLSYSRLAKANPKRMGLLSAGALMAGVTMMLRVLVVAGALNPALTSWLLLPLVFAALATFAMAAWQRWRQPDEGLDQPLELKNPFELGTVLKFTALLALVMLATKALMVVFGQSGVYLLAAISGIADVDALTLSMARTGQTTLRIENAAGAILLCVAVNTLSKAAMAWFAGGPGPGKRLLTGAFAGIAAGALGLALTLYLDMPALLRLLGNTI